MKIIQAVLILFILMLLVFQVRETGVIYYSEKGDIHYRSQQYKEALDNYVKASTFRANSVHFILKYIDLIIRQGEAKQGLKLLREVSRSHVHPDIELRLGKVLQSMRRFDAAVGHYERVHFMSPSKFRPLYYLAKLHYEKGDFVQADSIARVIIAKVPKRNSPEVFMIKEEVKAMQLIK